MPRPRRVPIERDLKEIYLSACYEPNLEKVKACLLLGADVNWACRTEGSGIQMAARENFIDLLELLLAQPDVNVNFIHDDDTTDTIEKMTALEIACEAGHASIVKRLCQHKDIKIGVFALNDAIMNNRVGCVEALKKFAGNKIDWKYQVVHMGIRRTPVAYAAKKGFAEVLEVLLSVVPGSRLDLNNVDTQGKTAMHLAVEENDGAHGLRCVQLLSRDERVDINIKNKDGETPIKLAMKKGKTEMVKILLLESMARENGMREILDLMWRPGPLSSGENLQARVTECPICLEQFTGDVEVHMCERGHVVCGPCRPSVQSCPTCRGPMIGRCHGFEDLLQNLNI